MSNWREPITDRTIADVRNYDAGSLDYQKGALNADDLNRIEDNYKYLMAKLRSDAIFIPHRLRNYTETVLEYVEKDNSILPDGYTQVEFIQSSGTQWIDSGIPFNVNNEYVMETECEWLDGDNTYSGWNAGGQFGNYSGYWGAGNSSSKTTAPIDGWAKIRLTIQAGSSSNTVIEVTQNGTTVSATRTHGSMASYATLNYPIFAYTNNSGGFQSYASTRMKSYKNWVNGTLTRNFIPCKNASGVAGMYDLVEGKFYTNVGAGTFTAGEEVIFKPETGIVSELVEITTTYTDWQEHNLPWLSEINRIRANYNALVRLFLVGLGFSEQKESNYLDYSEVNNWEKIALVGKTIFENMEKEYRCCGVEISGGDRLL